MDRDMFLAEALSREIVNYRALARWLRREHGLTGAVETIVSALRRYKSRGGWDLRSAREVLADAHVNTRSGTCTLVLPQAPGMEDLYRLVSQDAAEGVGRIRVIQTENLVTVIVGQRDLDGILQALGEGLPEEITTDLSELEIITPASAAGMPGVQALIAGALAARGVPVSFSVGGHREQLILVAREDALPAFEAIEDLIQASRRHET